MDMDDEWITPGGQVLQSYEEYMVRGQLRPWEEVIGLMRDISKSETEVELVIFVSSLDREVIFSFPVDSLEAKIMSEKLSKNMNDRSIAILRTDLKDRPIVVRMIDE
jgi:uncharacterized protein YihD (DUF1040 family)